MIKTIKIDKSRSVEINTSNGWLFIFQEQFGYDVLAVLMPAFEAMLKTVGKALQGIDLANEKIELAQVLQNLDDEAMGEIMSSFSGMQLTTIFNIVWAMAKNADDELPEPKTWLNSFDEFPADVMIKECLTGAFKASISKKNREKILGRLRSLTATSQTSTSSDSQSQDSIED